MSHHPRLPAAVGPPRYHRVRVSHPTRHPWLLVAAVTALVCWDANAVTWFVVAVAAVHMFIKGE